MQVQCREPWTGSGEDAKALRPPVSIAKASELAGSVEAAVAGCKTVRGRARYMREEAGGKVVVSGVRCLGRPSRNRLVSGNRNGPPLPGLHKVAVAARDSGPGQGTERLPRARAPHSPKRRWAGGGNRGARPRSVHHEALGEADRELRARLVPEQRWCPPAVSRAAQRQVDQLAWNQGVFTLLGQATQQVRVESAEVGRSDSRSVIRHRCNAWPPGPQVSNYASLIRPTALRTCRGYGSVV